MTKSAREVNDCEFTVGSRTKFDGLPWVTHIELIFSFSFET